MIAMTAKNGKTVRMSADFHIDIERVGYSVYCDGTTFTFSDFAPAARTYKTLSQRIEAGDDISVLLHNLAKGARLMGYSVTGKEVA